MTLEGRQPESHGGGLVSPRSGRGSAGGSLGAEVWGGGFSKSVLWGGVWKASVLVLGPVTDARTGTVLVPWSSSNWSGALGWRYWSVLGVTLRP